ncbi:YheC/YheD family endospore coat-associated protein [Alicyclobacillus dauci]|uniref:YheC/YheD family protein n=1 Tax=Alicyclobacillus dauci TaxID=1475485 RepID=A0ABY6Z2A1_9BACL|nr:YheC/YheD family protein [Alicyclobacillus dauci]WAH36326.1 YheC/YheD family protein [Alicyclobacillus dauci]
MTSSSSLTSPTVGVVLGVSAPVTSGVEELAKANKKARTKLYFFSTRGVDYDRKVIRGMWFNDAKKRWEKRTFPFPHVLYVRGGSGKSVQRLIEKFDDMGIKRINPIVAFNKSDLYYKLSQDKSVRKYLPYTKNLDLNDISELRAILRKRKTVYIKACRGRRGLQVVRVSRVSPGRYQYSYSILGRLVRREVRSYTRLQRALKSFFGSREVIVQQAIDLLTVNGSCLVDFRAELQRNRNGNLTVVAIPIRVGKKSSPITTHGTAYRFNDYLSKLLPNCSSKQIRETRNEIDHFLRTVYRSVEKVYGRFGEIGIDFAVDKNRNIWLIECNAQSAKVSIRRCYSQKTVHRIYRNPLEYAKTLV